MSAEEVLEFWFQQCRPWQWFRRRDSFDALVRERFGESVECALTGDLNHWSCGISQNCRRGRCDSAAIHPRSSASKLSCRA